MREIAAGRVAAQMNPLGAAGVLGMGLTTPRVVTAGNWWTAGGATNCIGAWQAVNAASFAASKTDLSGTGSNITNGTAFPTWSAAGLAFNGSTQYLVTTINGSATLSAIIAYTGVSTSVQQGLIGSTDNAVGGFGMYCYVGAKRYYNHGSAVLNVGASASSGVQAVTPVAGYYNSVSAGSLTANWAGVTPKPIWIGAINVIGSPGSVLSGIIKAVAIYNSTLTLAQVTAITTAINAL